MAVIPGTDLQAPQLIATALLDGSPTLLGWQVTRTSAPAPSDADFSAALPAASWTPVAVRGLHGEASRDVVIVADSIEEPPAVRVARWEDVEESQPLALQGRALSWGDPGEPVAEPVQCDLTGDGVADWMTGSKGSGAFAPHHVSVVSAASLSGTANLTALAGFDGLLPNAALVDVGIADLDHDGVCDLAVLQHSSGGFKVGVHFGPFPWPRSELSAFDTVFELDALPLTSATLVSGDLDGDGFLDLVAFVSDAAMWTMTGLPP
jgi:hypothetical protein